MFANLMLWATFHLLMVYHQASEFQNKKYEKSAGFDFTSFEYIDYLHRNYVDYVDPDNNFYKDIKIDCSYYTEAKFEH